MRIPSASTRSELRKSTLLRHSPTKPSQVGLRLSPVVSPKAVRICPAPLSHMMPRSVPRTLKRSTVLLGLYVPVTFSIAVVRPDRPGNPPVLPLSHGAALAGPPLLPTPLTPTQPGAAIAGEATAVTAAAARAATTPNTPNDLPARNMTPPWPGLLVLSSFPPNLGQSSNCSHR